MTAPGLFDLGRILKPTLSLVFRSSTNDAIVIEQLFVPLTRQQAPQTHFVWAAPCLEQVVRSAGPLGRRLPAIHGVPDLNLRYSQPAWLELKSFFSPTFSERAIHLWFYSGVEVRPQKRL
jgi:hypothetical protein